MFAVDPGLNGCGLAWFEGEQLKGAMYAPNYVGATPASPMAYRVYAMASNLGLILKTVRQASSDWVFERPRVYFDKRVNPDDLMPLAEIGACLMGMLEKTPTVYRPHEWKGSVDGLAMTLRIRERLSDEEVSRIVFPQNSCKNCRERVPFVVDEKICLKPRSCLMHNVYDGIGIGLHYLGRLERKRVIAR